MKTAKKHPSPESIYARILRLIQENGSLPDDFRCEENDPDDRELKFVPGGLEGILTRHFSENGENAGKIARFFLDHSAGRPEEVLRLYEDTYAHLKTATLRDELLRTIAEQKDSFDAGRLAELACVMMTEGVKTEAVKMGLTLMALFCTSENERVKNILLTLGCCEDFTDYVFVNISDWPEAEQNQIYFSLAKQLHGWGKIDAVEHLLADTDEIREWLLCEGCKNSILYGYLGLECAVKCDYLSRLRQGGLNEKELQGARDIMEGLLDEGPCPGLSGLDAPEETIYFYLCAAAGTPTDTESLRLLLLLRDYLEGRSRAAAPESADHPAQPEIPAEPSRLYYLKKAREKLTQLLGAPDKRQIILQELGTRPFSAIFCARALGIPVGEELLALMEKQFDTLYGYGHYFLDPPQDGPDMRKMAARYLALCVRRLDYAKLPVGMGRLHGLGKSVHWSVDMAVQYLGRFPGLGTELIRVSLRAPIVRWRHMAVRSLLEWKEHYGSSLMEFAPELYGDALDVSRDECDDDLKKRFAILLGWDSVTPAVRGDSDEPETGTI